MWKKILAVSIGLMFGYWLMDDFDPDALKNKRVVITGASTGIGEQIAYHYARMGARVFITARRESALRQVIKKCREVGDPNGEYHFIPADMFNLNATQKVIKAAEQKLGGVDILVLNHILQIPLGLWKGSMENFTLLENLMDVNYKSYVHLASHALPHLKKSKGSIIAVSSLAGKIGQPFVSSYSATKFAINGFFSTWRQELLLQDTDVSITLCTMGLVGTENTMNALKEFGQHFFLRSVTAASPSDAAYAIVKGGAKKQREMYFPYFQIKTLCLFRDWFPETIDAMIRYLYVINS